MFEFVQSWLAEQGMQSGTAYYVGWAIVVVAVVLIAVIANLITRRILLTALSIIIRRTKTKWDDALLERRVLHRAAHVAPALVFYWLAAAFPGLEDLIQRLAMVYIMFVVASVISAFLNALLDVYGSLDLSRNRPIKGFVQLARIILFVFVAILTVAILFEQSPLGLLGGLGALTAVLVLVFKDTILGLVASFQISSSDIVRVGDWIEVAQYGADGTVIDISLLQVRVQNWNKTISTVPTYALVSESFKNWRGMEESGGRRIKRSINIDMNSIRFCNAEMLERFQKFGHIKEYVENKIAELSRYNEERQVDMTYLVNGRHMTNVGTFRAYIEAYLSHHPEVHSGMTFLVRQLQPGEHGLPIEIYIFSKEQAWVRYESIQADIFDHLLAVLPLFDLRVFQSPTGDDFRSMGKTT